MRCITALYYFAAASLVGCTVGWIPPTQNVTVIVQNGTASPPVTPTQRTTEAAPCNALLNVGTEFAWRVFQNGQQTNQGFFRVTSFDGQSVTLEQYAEGTSYQILARFVGSTDGTTLQMDNTHPQFPERWIGTCGSQSISGSLQGYTFDMVPRSTQ